MTLGGNRIRCKDLSLDHGTTRRRCRPHLPGRLGVLHPLPSCHRCQHSAHWEHRCRDQLQQVDDPRQPSPPKRYFAYCVGSKQASAAKDIFTNQRQCDRRTLLRRLRVDTESIIATGTGVRPPRFLGPADELLRFFFALAAGTFRATISQTNISLESNPLAQLMSVFRLIGICLDKTREQIAIFLADVGVDQFHGASVAGSFEISFFRFGVPVP